MIHLLIIVFPLFENGLKSKNRKIERDSGMKLLWERARQEYLKTSKQIVNIIQIIIICHM